MGGKDTRDGLWFQDARILVRLLADGLERRRRQVLGEDVGPPLRIAVEASVDGEGEPNAPRAWDSVTYAGERVVVEETKLGEVKASHRRAFYRRIMATVAATRDDFLVVPRLTVATSSQANPEKWRQLAAAEAEAERPSNPPGSANDAHSLAQEALFHLTTPDDGVKALSEDVARSLLRRFMFDEALDRDGVASELQRLFVILGIDVAIDATRQQLRGWIDEHARDRGAPVELTCDLLVEQLALVARHLAIPVSTGNLWQRLRTATPSPPQSTLGKFPWRAVQSDAVAQLDTTTSRLMCLVGVGGIGKSSMLAQLRQERPGCTAGVDASANLTEVEEAIALGAWGCSLSGASLRVYVDALEHADAPGQLLASLERAVSACADAVIIAAAQPSTWERATNVRGWTKISLSPWPTDVVVAAAKDETCSADLIEMLRNPFLLDLFKRTPRSEDAPSPARRHELIANYFRTRILCGHDAAGRRSLLRFLGERAARAQFRSEVPPEHTARAKELYGEGVLSDVGGLIAFRHSALQDVCIALAIADESAERCARGLAKISPPTLRQDAARALIEAGLEKGSRALFEVPPPAQLLRAIERIAVDLREVIADASVGADDLDELLGGSAILAEILPRARAAGNLAWLQAIAATAPSPRPRWLPVEGLPITLYHLVDFARRVALPARLRGPLAIRMRAWARGQDLDSPGLDLIASFVLKHCPDTETARWLLTYPRLPFASSLDFFEGLRKLATKSRDLPDRELAELVLRSHAGYSEDRESARQSFQSATNSLVIHCLQPGHDDTPGLFDSRPEAAYQVLFELVARAAERLGRWPLGELDDEEVGDDASAQGADIVNDVPLLGWMPDGQPLHGVWITAARRFRESPELQPGVRRVAEASRSRAARNLVAGHDAIVADPGENISGPRQVFPDDPAPEGAPTSLDRAWRLLQLISLARNDGIRSSFVEHATMETVLADADTVAWMPAWAMRWLSHIASTGEDHTDEQRRRWCGRMLEWLAGDGVDPKRCVNALEFVAACLRRLAEPQHATLLERFVTTFERRFHELEVERQAHLLFVSYDLVSDHPRLIELLVRWIQRNPSPQHLHGTWIALLRVPSDAFLTSVESLLTQPMSEEFWNLPAARLGRMCLDGNSGAWDAVQRWLAADRSVDDPWVSFLDSLAQGAGAGATQDFDRYGELAVALWRARCETPSRSGHLMRNLLLYSDQRSVTERRGIALALMPVVQDVIRQGDWRDVQALRNLPWEAIPRSDIDRTIDSLAARIEQGPPVPDPYAHFGAAISYTLAALLDADSIAGAQAERLRALVLPRAWIVSNIDLSQRLLDRARLRRIEPLPSH